jgi:rhodanese-related sulfurtransferase
MKKTILFVLLSLLTLSLAAQMKQQPKAAAPAGRTPLAVGGAAPRAAAGFSRISIDDAVKLQKSGEAVFVDVRSHEQYSLGHIKGALSIPGSQLLARFREVPPRKTVITYCACGAEQSSGHAVQNLAAHGVKNIFALKGGWTEWKERGLPTATGSK